MYLTIGGKIQATEIRSAITARKCLPEGPSDLNNQRPDKWSANE
jgi:hypothetical protein